MWVRLDLLVLLALAGLKDRRALKALKVMLEA
jgi:hypothetical protein